MSKYQYIRAMFIESFRGHDYRQMYRDFNNYVWPRLKRQEQLQSEYLDAFQRKNELINTTLDTRARIRVRKYAARRQYRGVLKLRKENADLRTRLKSAEDERDALIAEIDILECCGSCGWYQRGTSSLECHNPKSESFNDVREPSNYYEMFDNNAKCFREAKS